MELPTIKKEYEDRGYKFKSNSDSRDYIISLQEKELERLDRMFSFVIYDDNKLILSRG